MLLIRVGISCFSFGSRVHKRFPIFPLWPEESKLSIWEMQAWPYSLSFLSWKMSTEKSTKACNISSQAKQASSIPFVRANLWWDSEDHMTDLVTHHRYVFAQTAGGSVEGSIFHSAWCVSWFSQDPHYCISTGQLPKPGNAPWFGLAGSAGRLGTTWVPKLNCVRNLTWHIRESLEIRRMLWGLWKGCEDHEGLLSPGLTQMQEQEGGRHAAHGCAAQLHRCGNAPPVRGARGWKCCHCQGILSWKTQILC